MHQNNLLTFAIVLVIVAVAAIYIGYGLSNALHVKSSALGVNHAPSEYIPVQPGAMPLFSCPLITKLPQQVAIFSTIGLGIYNISGVIDYVLQPGDNASIKYGFYQEGSGTTTYPNGTTVTRAYNGQQSEGAINLNTIFYHQEQLLVNYTVTQVNGSAQVAPSAATANLSNSSIAQNASSQTPLYRACYNISGLGASCTYSASSPATTSVYVNVTSSAHYGISANSTLVNASSSGQVPYAVLDISANSTAQTGTYWMTVGGDPCSGGQLVLLTIGASQYSGVVSRQIFS